MFKKIINKLFPVPVPPLTEEDHELLTLFKSTLDFIRQNVIDKHKYSCYIYQYIDDKVSRYDVAIYASPTIELETAPYSKIRTLRLEINYKLNELEFDSRYPQCVDIFSQWDQLCKELLKLKEIENANKKRAAIQGSLSEIVKLASKKGK